MSETPESETTKTPLHLWIVGVVTVLWNAMGALDYLMVELKNEAWMSSYSQAQVDFITNYPMWVVAAWAIAVWGGLAGSVLLLMRKRLATKVFLVSWGAMVLTTFYSYVLSNGMEAFGDAGTLIFSSVIFLVALGLVFYARAMERRAVLR